VLESSRIHIITTDPGIQFITASMGVSGKGMASRGEKKEPG
jgi:hypothetical protein